VLPRLKEDKKKHRRMCALAGARTLQLCWAQADLCSHDFQTLLQDTDLSCDRHQAIKLEKYRNKCILVNEVFLGLFSVFIKAKLTIG